jgi:uncharacterized iron-regulated protein
VIMPMDQELNAWPLDENYVVDYVQGLQMLE